MLAVDTVYTIHHVYSSLGAYTSGIGFQYHERKDENIKQAILNEQQFIKTIPAVSSPLDKIAAECAFTRRAYSTKSLCIIFRIALAERRSSDKMHVNKAKEALFGGLVTDLDLLRERDTITQDGRIETGYQ